MINLLISKYTGDVEKLPLPEYDKTRVIVIGLERTEELFNVIEFYKAESSPVQIEAAQDHVIITKRKDDGKNARQESTLFKGTLEDSIRFYINI